MQHIEESGIVERGRRRTPEQRAIARAIRKRTDRWGYVYDSIGAAHASNIEIAEDEAAQAGANRVREGLGQEIGRNAVPRDIQFGTQRRVLNESNLPPQAHAVAMANIDAAERAARTIPSGVRAFVGLDARNIPTPQTRSLPPTSDAEGYALARRDQIAIRDGVDKTTASLTFGREEPEAWARYRQALNAKVNPAATSILGPQGQAAIQQFDNRVMSARGADPNLSAEDAIVKIAAQFPDLARARTIALSVPVGPHGVAMVNS